MLVRFAQLLVFSLSFSLVGCYGTRLGLDDDSSNSPCNTTSCVPEDESVHPCTADRHCEGWAHGNGLCSASGSCELSVAVCESAESDAEQGCSDCIDNDGDGIFDCEDTDCASAPECDGSGAGDDDDSGDADDDDGDDDDTGDDDASSDDGCGIVMLSSSNGSAEGGESVTITCTNDLSTVEAADVSVTFGGTEATVLSVVSGAIEVQTPLSCLAAAVDVVVTVAAAAPESTSYTYTTWANGLDGAVMSISRSLMPSVSVTNYQGNALAEIFDPMTSPPLSYLPASGQCIPFPSIALSNRPNYDIGSSVTLSAGGSPIELFRGSDNSYAASGLGGSQLSPSSSYTFQGGADPDGCATEYVGAIETPSEMLVTVPDLNGELCEPTTFCWFKQPDIWGFPPYQEGGQVDWALGTDAVLFQFDYCGSTPCVPTLLCHIEESAFGGAAASVSIDAADFATAPPGPYLLSVMRYRTTQTTDPRTGATVHGTAIDMKSGNVWIMDTVDDCMSACN